MKKGGVQKSKFNEQKVKPLENLKWKWEKRERIRVQEK